MERIIESGKHKGQRLSQCPIEYIKWATSHQACYGPDNKWISQQAKKLLEKKEEKAMNFQVGQYVEKNGQVGLVQHIYAYAYKVCTGEYQSTTWSKGDALIESSKEAYDAQIASNEAALQAAKTALRQKRSQTAYRWLCLECNTKHNAHECPSCGSDERLHNTDTDTDPSILAEVGAAAPYGPKDESHE